MTRQQQEVINFVRQTPATSLQLVRLNAQAYCELVQMGKLYQHPITSKWMVSGMPTGFFR